MGREIKKVVIVFFASVFVFQGIAEAASISSRVRILESKVYKQDKKIKQQSRQQKQLKNKVDDGLQEIKDIKFQVTNFMKNSETKKKKLLKSDRGYSFP